MREGELSAGKRLVLFFKLWAGGQAKGSEGPAQFLPASSDQPKLEKLYNLRTSVERVFSRLKGYLGANALKVRGIKKVTAHLTLCCILLLAGTLALHHHKAKSVA